MALTDWWGDTKEKKYGVPRGKMPYQADRQRDAPSPDYPTEPPEITHPSELASPTATSESFWESEHAPLMIAAAEVLFGTIFDFFTTSPAEALVEEQLDYAQVQRLRASGVFSDEDIAQIQEGFAPMVNAVAGNVASRGLGSSASGAAIIAQAQAAPLHRLQAHAAQIYQTSLISASNFIAMLAKENISFSRSFGNITKLYETMREDSKESGQPPSDPLFADYHETLRRHSELMQEEIRRMEAR